MTSTVHVPAPRSRMPIIRLARGAWTLPTNVVGLLIGLLVSGGLGIRLFRSPAAWGILFPVRIPGLRMIGAVTLGNAILFDEAFLRGGDANRATLRKRLILAHELAHTRQHDVLGPFFLPAHLVAQALCSVAFVFRRPPRGDPIHAGNPLEQTWLCLGFDAISDLLDGQRLSESAREDFLRAFGV